MNHKINFDTAITDDPLLTDLQQLPRSVFSVFSSFTEPFLLLNTRCSVVLVNDKANEIIKNISGNSFTPGDSMLTLFAGEQQTILKKHLEEVVSGATVNYEVEILKNGHSIWLECCYKPLENEQGICGICATIKDITLRKEFEGKLIPKLTEDKHFQSKILFEAFMETTPLTAWITDDKGEMLYLNPAFRKLYKLPFDNLPRHMEEIFPKDLADEYFQNNLLALQSGKMIEVIERSLKADGSIAVFKAFKFPMNIGEQKMVGGWSIEITEETKLQQQLTNSIERYGYVHEATSDAIYDWEILTDTLYCGKGFALLFGYHNSYEPLELRFNRIHPEDISRIKKTYQDSITDATLRRWKIEYRFKDAKGVYRNVVDKAFIIREDEKAVKVIGAIQDITEYKQLQEKLLRQEESKKRAIVRSIIEAQEKERRQLSVELHDNVNQILSSCKLMLEVAKENKDKAHLLTEKSYHSIQIAMAEIRKISHDLNPSSVEDFGLKEAITEMVDKINLSGKINIVFRLVSSSKKIILKSEDKIAIYRIVQEQLNNILKHAQAKNALIDVSIKSSEISLLIKDDGKGFNGKKINKGIGLKNIHHRVEYYRGKIAIETGRNKGCKMSILLNIASN